MENVEIIFNDHPFIGNAFVGPKNSGKKTLCSYYAYITGSELLIFNPENEYPNLNENLQVNHE